MTARCVRRFDRYMNEVFALVDDREERILIRRLTRQLKRIERAANRRIEAEETAARAQSQREQDRQYQRDRGAGFRNSSRVGAE